MAKTMKIIQPEYFSPPLDNVVRFVKEYFTKHHGCPDVDLIEAETEVELKPRHLDSSERSYFLTQIEDFCQTQAMAIAILKASDFVNGEEKSKIREIIQDAFRVKIDRSLGMDIFDDPRNRITTMAETVDERRIGIGPFDDIFGKVRRGELYLIYGTSSAGKSVGLGNIAYKLSDQGLNVVVISLELDELLYSKRMDSIITGTDIDSHLESVDDIEEGLEHFKEHSGSVIIKRMRHKPSVEDIRDYLTEYHLEMDYYPDVLIVDYLALMGTVKNHKGKYEEHEEIAHGLRDLGGEFGMYTFSAGQINREGQDVVNITPAHCQGGISVIQASDGALFIAATEEDLDNNQLQVGQLKIRSNKKSSKRVTMYMNPKNLRMSDSPIGTSQKSSSPVSSYISQNKTAAKTKKEDPKLKDPKSKLKKAIKLIGEK